MKKMVYTCYKHQFDRTHPYHWNKC
jgi:hypothetical protein